MRTILSPIILLLLLAAVSTFAFERPDQDFKAFQFPPEHIPHIDGKTVDWDIVGEEYTYRTD